MPSSNATVDLPAGPGDGRRSRDAATLADLLSRQAAATPDRVAVACAGHELSYGELEARANRLAHLLRRHGVGPEVQVALAMERGLDVVVALAAIVQAGGAYVPFDPAYPAERLATMARVTGCRLLVADRPSLDRMPALGELGLDPAAVVIPAQAAEVLEGLPEAPPEVSLTGDHLAYVNFTSGSTGEPKGVAIPHRAVVRLVVGATYADLGPGEVILHLAPLSFDAATFEIWGPLANGGTVAVYPPGPVSLDELARWLPEAGVTGAFLTAGLFHQLVDTHPEALGGFRRLLAGGEVLSVPHVGRAVEAVGGTLANAYGPTECTTFTTWHPVDAPPEGAVPIGRPIQRTRVEVLSPALEPLPAGAEGQLAIGGDGLARGYLGRPAATAAVFVPDPTGAEPGARLYLSGDLARRRDDGALDFLGRIDDQVKVRGFRIEPGEIESVLAEHPEVAAAVVLAEPDPAGGRRLVAFVARRPGTGAGVEALTGWLEARLPAFMVPAAFELLEELPLGPTGKVDRRALAERRRAAAVNPRPDLAAPYVAPRTPLEERVAAMWAEMLGLERVGVEDDLFALGGHSLLATRILARLREEHGTEIPLQVVFENPTVAALAEHLEGGPGAAGFDPESPSVRGPQPHDHGGEAPLAFPQQRVWFLQKLEPESLAYNFQAELRFRGDFRPGAFLAAARAMVARHEVLLTAYPSRGGSPVQEVHPAAEVVPTVGLPMVDLSALPAERVEAERLRRRRQAYMRSYDLDRAPLIYWIDFKLAQDDHAVLHGEHHLIHDGWGFNVFLEELAELYAAALEGRPSSLPALPVQFADFALWQHELLESGEVDRQLDYWEGQLTGSPPLLELPYDRPRPPAQTFRGTSFRARIPAELSVRLRALARRHGATIYQVLNAGFLSLLHRYTGATDVSVGVGVANRRFASTERMLGMLVNTVVLRNDLSGDPSFEGLLERVGEVTREAWAHQDVPLDRVVERVRPGRDASYNPLFQVGFHFHDSPLADIALPGVELEAALGLPNGSSKFDLSVICILPREQKLGRRDGEPDEDLDAVQLLWEYSTDLFDEATMHRMLGHYLRLLEGVVAAPGAPLSRLPVLSGEERHEVLHGFNDTASGYPREASLADLFAEVAGRTPEAPAVVMADGGATLTYGELDRASARLARRLAARGVGPGVPVALALERSPELVAAMLAVTRAGGVYVPLDLGYPEERLTFMLEDTEPAVVLTRRHRVSSLPAALAGDGDRTWMVDGLLEDAAESDEAEAEPASPSAEDPLYIMYTSGSTGHPKGVTVPHRAVARLVREPDFADLGPDQTLLQLASPSFDASTLEVWGALANGGRLVVMPPEVPSLAGLGEAVQDHGVTTLWLTAGLFHQVVDEALDGLDGVRQLLAGGDVLSPGHVRRALEGLPGTTVINGYGPTENTTFTCCHRMTAAAQVEDPVPVGRPIADTRVYVLDPGLEPVPVGVAGELWAAGDGLALGYHRRPALTAAAFRPDPFQGDGGGVRMYRTGDLVRWRPDGSIDFLGRRDGQVKLRGFRVEVGEVEAVLTAHPAVRDAAAVVRDDGGDRRLAAFVVAARDGGVDGGELRSWMGRRLPDYMLPAVLVAVDALPLNPNGKVDRRELAARPLEAPAATSDDGYLAPRNEIEELLVDVWRELIGVQRIGVADDFFALGGHSLHATRMVHRLRDLLEIDLPVRSLYEAPTIERLAQRVEAALLEDLEGSEEPAGV